MEELDGKGGARVRLGLLSTRLEVTELLPEGRAARVAPQKRVSRGKRPALGSSHRRR